MSVPKSTHQLFRRAEWEKRTLVHHAGGWKRGDAAKSKHERVAIQNDQFTLVFNEELYDLKADPGETNNVITEHPEIVKTLRKAYDKWWEKVTPRMINEDQYEEPETMKRNNKAPKNAIWYSNRSGAKSGECELDNVCMSHGALASSL